MTCHVSVVVHTPAHSQVSGPLTYGSAQPLVPGTLVRVPLGKRETLGVVWDTDPHAPPPPDSMDVKPVASVLDALAPLPAAWRDWWRFLRGITSARWGTWLWRRCRRSCATWGWDRRRAASNAPKKQRLRHQILLI